MTYLPQKGELVKIIYGDGNFVQGICTTTSKDGLFFIKSHGKSVSCDVSNRTVTYDGEIYNLDSVVSKKLEGIAPFGIQGGVPFFFPEQKNRDVFDLFLLNEPMKKTLEMLTSEN